MIKHRSSPLLRLFPRKFDAVTLGRHVFFRSSTPSERLIRHEAVHVGQYQREGVVKFLVKYLYYSARYGYEQNPYEVEARDGL